MGEIVYLAYYELSNLIEYNFRIIGVSKTFEGAKKLIDNWMDDHAFKIDPSEETVDIYEITLDELF